MNKINFTILAVLLILSAKVSAPPYDWPPTRALLQEFNNQKLAYYEIFKSLSAQPSQPELEELKKRIDMFRQSILNAASVLDNKVKKTKERTPEANALIKALNKAYDEALLEIRRKAAMPETKRVLLRFGLVEDLIAIINQY